VPARELAHHRLRVGGGRVDGRRRAEALRELPTLRHRVHGDDVHAVAGGDHRAAPDGPQAENDHRVASVQSQLADAGDGRAEAARDERADLVADALGQRLADVRRYGQVLGVRAVDVVAERLTVGAEHRLADAAVLAAAAPVVLVHHDPRPRGEAFDAAADLLHHADGFVTCGLMCAVTNLLGVRTVVVQVGAAHRGHREADEGPAVPDLRLRHGDQLDTLVTEDAQGLHRRCPPQVATKATAASPLGSRTESDRTGRIAG
jgi:hypothetical protein